ncbi:MAG: ABC transporter substrate-binding protein [Candidatus Bathyarchaeota archaeon]|nr:ABC transporter substrate-binding protein [Candidatus Bathyarchaeota archaeon]
MKSSSVMLVAALLVGLLIGYGVCSFFAPAAPAVAGLQGQVKIGGLLPLSGPLGTYGEDIKAAIEVAQEDVNAYLSTAGAEWTVVVEYEDTQTVPEVALEKFESLAGRGIKIVLGPMASGSCAAVKSYADTNDILYISPSSTATELSIPGDNLFRLCALDDLQGPAMAATMYSAGIRIIVSEYADNVWGAGLDDIATQKFEELGGTVQESIGWDPDTTEFSPVVEAINSAVEAALAKGFALDEIGVLHISYRKGAVSIFPVALLYPTLVKVKWFGSDGTVMLPDLADLEEAPDPTNFALTTEYTNTMFAIPESPTYTSVRSKIISKIGREPTIYAYSAYDSVWLVALALATVNDYDPMKVKDTFPTVTGHYTGASGSITLNANGDLAAADYALWRPVETDGVVEWKTVGKYDHVTGTVTWYT